MTPTRRAGLLFTAAVLLTGLAYVAHEVESLSANEKLVRQAYERQMEAVLFSVNQHVLDVLSSWSVAVEQDLSGLPGRAGATASIRRSNPSLLAVFATDSLFRSLEAIDADTAISLPKGVADTLSRRAIRLLAYRRSGYRRIEPVRLTARDSGRVAMLFVADGPATNRTIGLMLIDAPAFIQTVLGPRLRDIARESIRLAVLTGGTSDPIYTTTPMQPSDVKAEQTLWALPGYRLVVQETGATIDAVLRRRFIRAMILIVLLGAALGGGGWFFYRNVRRQAELARLKSDFIANVSHELRTPLSMIHMFAETLEMGRVRSDEKRQEYYRIIAQETDRLARLVNNILNFSRIEAGRKIYHFAQVDLNSVVESVLGTYRPGMESAGFTVTVNFAEHLPPVKADAEAVSEAVLNLLDNASKYSGDVRAVAVSMGSVNGAVFIEVADRGVGIAREHHRKVFDQFYRVEGGTAKTASGTGLGLSLVRHIMEAHGGRAELESEPGKGSRFRLVFLCTEDEKGASVIFP